MLSSSCALDAQRPTALYCHLLDAWGIVAEEEEESEEEEEESEEEEEMEETGMMPSPYHHLSTFVLPFVLAIEQLCCS